MLCKAEKSDIKFNMTRIRPSFIILTYKFYRGHNNLPIHPPHPKRKGTEKQRRKELLEKHGLTFKYIRVPHFLRQISVWVNKRLNFLSPTDCNRKR